MWFAHSLHRGDEEALFHSSPRSQTPIKVVSILPPRAEWRRLPKLFSHALSQLVIFMIPSFLRRTSPTNTTSEKAAHQAPTRQKKDSTKYLDGVRGLASFIVFMLHWTHLQYPGVNSGYINGHNSSIWQLPMIRFIYSGAAMVSVFFVVSGYVLTHRFIQQMYRHEFESLFSSLTSLTFRRAIRLFLPAFGSCMLAYLCASFKLIPVPKKIGGKVFHHDVKALLNYLDSESNPWTWDLYMKGFYNPQLWSIAVEYRGSMVVFLTILGVAKFRTSVRIFVETAIITHGFSHKRWDVALFIAGMLVAELDILVQISSARKIIMQKKGTRILLSLIMLIGIYLSGFPRDYATESMGYGFSKYTWPPGGYRRRFWLSVGSIMIIGPMPYLSFVQAFFCTRPMVYLGKISFALYLIHGLGNRTAGTLIMLFTWHFLGKDGYWNYALSFVVSSLLYIPVVIWWSDMYWRAVDIPSTRFAKWLERRCAAEESSSMVEFD